MKQKMTQELPIELGIDLSTVQKVEFVFNQNGRNIWSCSYPSTDATKKYTNRNIIAIKFTKKIADLFDTEKPIYMDTRITLTNSIYNPETEIVSFTLSRSLFTN